MYLINLFSLLRESDQFVEWEHEFIINLVILFFNFYELKKLYFPFTTS